jgi:hypothetical protein
MNEERGKDPENEKYDKNTGKNDIIPVKKAPVVK